MKCTKLVLDMIRTLHKVSEDSFLHSAPEKGFTHVLGMYVEPLPTSPVITIWKKTSKNPRTVYMDHIRMNSS